MEESCRNARLFFLFIFAQNHNHMPLIHEYELTVVTDRGIEPIISIYEASEQLGIGVYAVKTLIFGAPQRGGGKLRGVILRNARGMEKNLHVIVDDDYREVQQAISENFIKKNRNTKIVNIRRVKDILKEIRGK